ncbi:MAG: hypothetical protein AAFV53_08885 [Myxococcota bacterium]
MPHPIKTLMEDVGTLQPEVDPDQITKTLHRIFDLLLSEDLNIDELAPTCPCFLAVDIGLPTIIAVVMLELLVEEGVLMRRNLQEVVWRGSNGQHPLDISYLSEHETSLLLRFANSLHLYIPYHHTASNAAELYRPFLVRLVTMLAIEEQVLFNKRARSRAAYQGSLSILERLQNDYNTPQDHYPVAMKAELCFGDAGAQWAGFSRQLEVFRRFEARHSTQLSIILHLGLVLAGGSKEHPQPWSLEQLNHSTPKQRQQLLARLGHGLSELLDYPGSRDGFLLRLFDKDSFFPKSSMKSADLVDVWWEWLCQQAKTSQDHLLDHSLATIASETLIRLDEPPYTRQEIRSFGKSFFGNQSDEIEHVLYTRLRRQILTAGV